LNFFPTLQKYFLTLIGTYDQSQNDRRYYSDRRICTEDRLTNADLEKIVDTNDEWIRTRTGVEERRILRGAGKATSDMCVPVVEEICKSGVFLLKKLIVL